MDEKEMYFRRIVNQSPIDFTHMYCTWMGEQAKGLTQQVSTSVISILDDHRNPAKIIEIDKDLLNLIVDTKNEIFYRPLFFNSIFINNDIVFKGHTIKGLLISDLNRNDLKFDDSNKLTREKASDLLLYATIVNPEDFSEYYCYIRLLTEVAENREDFKNEEERKFVREVNKFIRLLAVNIIDTVEGMQEDIEQVEIRYPKEQNLKREKRGKSPLRDKIIIKPKGNFIKYVSDYNIGKGSKIGFRFVVMGHWRHFRSIKYKDKVGTKIWIKPQIRGKGILINRKYKLVGDDSN